MSTSVKALETLGLEVQEQLIEFLNGMKEKDAEHEHAYLYAVIAFGIYFMTVRFGHDEGKRVVAGLFDGIENIDTNEDSQARPN